MTHQIQIDDVVREATPEEVAAVEAIHAAAAAEEQIALEKAAAKAALLERLGMTADEAALIFA